MNLFAKLLKKLLSPRHTAYIIAHRYIKRYEGFSYNFEKNGEERLLNSLKKFKINNVFDVGANVGAWTIIAANEFEYANIHSFELSDTTFETLSKNLLEYENIKLVNYGLSDESGNIKYKDYGKNNGANTIIVEADFHDTESSHIIKNGILTTGDKYCQDHKIDEIDILKIDVEGAEHLVLKGFAEKLSKGKIKVIQFEYGYTHADAKFLIKDFYKLLSEYGYLVGPLKPGGVIFMDFDYYLNGFNSGPNYVAVHKNQKQLIAAVKGPKIKGFPRS